MKILINLFYYIVENEDEFLDKKILQPELGKVVAYFERVLTIPGGSLFLPGLSGFGRKTAIRIVAARQSAKLFSFKVSKEYGTNHFKSDLKMVRLNFIIIIIIFRMKKMKIILRFCFIDATISRFRKSSDLFNS